VSRGGEAVTVACLVAADLAVAGLGLGLAVGPAVAGAPLVVGAAVVLLGAALWAGAYQTSRAWGASEALPVAMRAVLVAGPVAVAAGIALGVSWGRGLAVAGWWLLGLTAVRLLAGRIRRALLRRGVGVRRAIVVGDATAAERVASRLARHAWLGARVIGRVGPPPAPGALGDVHDLASILVRHRADVVWLAPPADGAAPVWPPLLFEPAGASVVWRMLPDDFARSQGALTPAERAIVESRVRRDVALPTVRVAMIGSRGVPASYSGIERSVEEVGSYLAAHGAEVAVYCHAKYVSARGTHRGMRLRFVPAIRSRHLETLSHTLLATCDVLLRSDEIIHYHALGPSTLAWLPRLAGRTVVATVQGLDWQRAKWGRLARGYLRFGEWATARFPHRTIVVSRALAHYYTTRYRTAPVHIPNGFTRPVPRPPARIRALGLDRDGYLLFVGRLVPEKECHTLLRAYRRVGTALPLVIAGAGVYEDAYVRRLHDEARDLPGVRFIGFASGETLDELYSNARLVVHPSQMEGLSVALLEALSHGHCVLVSDVPENLEVVRDAGATFRVGDVEDLARRLGWLLEHPAEVEAFRARARALAPGLIDWDRVAAATLALYDSLVAPAGRPAADPQAALDSRRTREPV
jgi:glycosyltransferase involved in cell wall biosynthesis